MHLLLHSTPLHSIGKDVSTRQCLLPFERQKKQFHVPVERIANLTKSPCPSCINAAVAVVQANNAIQRWHPMTKQASTICINRMPRPDTSSAYNPSTTGLLDWGFLLLQYVHGGSLTNSLLVSGSQDRGIARGARLYARKQYLNINVHTASRYFAPRQPPALRSLIRKKTKCE